MDELLKEKSFVLKSRLNKRTQRLKAFGDMFDFVIANQIEPKEFVEQTKDILTQDYEKDTKINKPRAKSLLEELVEVTQSKPYTPLKTGMQEMLEKRQKHFSPQAA